MDQDFSEFGNIKIEIDVAEDELLERRHEEKDQMTGTNHYCIFYKLFPSICYISNYSKTIMFAVCFLFIYFIIIIFFRKGGGWRDKERESQIFF
jgi:hypothetical protein